VCGGGGLWHLQPCGADILVVPAAQPSAASVVSEATKKSRGGLSMGVGLGT
jgi:hypothetical protein